MGLNNRRIVHPPTTPAPNTITSNNGVFKPQLPAPLHPGVLCLLHPATHVRQRDPRVIRLQSEQRKPESLALALSRARQSARRSVPEIPARRERGIEQHGAATAVR